MSIIKHKDDISYLVEIMEVFNKFLLKRKSSSKHKEKDDKLIMAVEAFKALLS